VKLAGKSVALVGNATSALARDHGALIDSQDVVIRMNAGVPHEDQFHALGARTDILSVGTVRVLEDSVKRLNSRLTDIWFCKATKMGNREWEHLCRDWRFPHLWRIPQEWIRASHEAVGGKSSQGVTLGLALVGALQAESVLMFGVDFFGANGSAGSWWHDTAPKAVITKRRPHNGQREMETFQEAGYTEREPGCWEWTRFTTR